MKAGDFLPRGSLYSVLALLDTRSAEVHVYVLTPYSLPSFPRRRPNQGKCTPLVRRSILAWVRLSDLPPISICTVLLPHFL